MKFWSYILTILAIFKELATIFLRICVWNLDWLGDRYAVLTCFQLCIYPLSLLEYSLKDIHISKEIQRNLFKVKLKLDQIKKLPETKSDHFYLIQKNMFHLPLWILMWVLKCWVFNICEFKSPSIRHIPNIFNRIRRKKMSRGQIPCFDHCKCCCF